MSFEQNGLLVGSSTAVSFVPITEEYKKTSKVNGKATDLRDNFLWLGSYHNTSDIPLTTVLTQYFLVLLRKNNKIISKKWIHVQPMYTFPPPPQIICEDSFYNTVVLLHISNDSLALA